MPSIYKRGNIWWIRICKDNGIIRESTKCKDEDGANEYLQRRLKELYPMERFSDYKKPIPDLPKILLYDLETAPMELYAWNLWQKFFPVEAIKKDVSILTWSAKWLFDDVMYSASVTPEEAFNREDKRIIPELWQLFEEADIIIAHNAERFDNSFLNHRLIINGFNPPAPYQTIDTFKAMKKVAKFSSLGLDYMNKVCKLPQKLHHEGLAMWKKYVSGDPELAQPAREMMLRYNQHDVTALEEFYLHIRPWIKSHPNVSLYMTMDRNGRCANCGAPKPSKITSSPYTTPAGQYESYRCLACGAIGRSRYSQTSAQKRNATILSTAR